MTEFVHDAQTRKAVELAKAGVSFFITGKAGTGKTMLLEEIVRRLGKHRCAVTAPTGVAARHAGGQTMHSLLGLPLAPYIPGHRLSGLYKLPLEKQMAINLFDVLIIDEVSMVRCDLMDMMDDVLRHYRNSDKPFGGMQVILFGDLYQLMPVAKDDEWEKLKRYYNSPYFFSSDVLRRMRVPILELTTVHRQSDNKFVDLLNRVRDGILTYEDERRLMTRYNNEFDPADSLGYIRLTTHRYKARKINVAKLDDLSAQPYEYKALIEGIYPKEDWPTDYVLTFKLGVRVMFIANDNWNFKFVNGTLGTVVDLDEKEVTVATDDGQQITVGRRSWDFYDYRINRQTKVVEQRLLGTFHQIPLQLAWSVTIHKSQGLTFDRVVVDAGKAFAAGQVYVALSRCRTLSGIVLTSKISKDAVRMDERVTEYIQLTEKIICEGGAVDNVPVGQNSKGTETLLKEHNYKPVGHLFRAPWDGKLYDCWEDADHKFCLDRLEERNGELHRLSIGTYPDDTAAVVFEILDSRQYNKITALESSGSYSYMTIAGKRIFSHRGREVRVKVAFPEDPRAVYDREPMPRTYDYRRSGDELVIGKHSKLSDSTPSRIKEYSDLGKLILCCDCYRILRDVDNKYVVAVDDGGYRLYEYDYAGRALSDGARIIADKWYLKNKGQTSFTKSYDAVPVTRASVTKKSEQVKPTAFAKTSLEYKIIECLKEGRPMKAIDIARRLGCTRNEVNSRLYGPLKAARLVKINADMQWSLATK